MRRRLERHMEDVKHCDAFCATTVLHVACGGGHAEVVDLLLQNGADVTRRDPEGRTPLHFAAWQGSAAVMRLLLQHDGRDVDATDDHQSTALHLACQQGYAGVIRQLLEAGANPPPRDGEGRMRCDVAVAKGHDTCVRVLQGWDRAYVLMRSFRCQSASTDGASVGPS